jgi:hypothetical protein
MIPRTIVALLVAVGACWPVAAHAEASEPVQPTDQVVLSGDVTVARGTVVDEVVVFSGSATISGVVTSDVVVLDGPVTIAGQVAGNVVALHGSIHLLETAHVGGDVVAGGNLVEADGAQVTGVVRQGVGFTLAGPVGVLGALLVSVAMAVSILLGGLLVLLLAPRGAERAAEAARSAPLPTVGWGLLIAIALPLMAIALSATIVGLPLGLTVLLGLALVWLLGLVVTTFAIGRLVLPAPRSRMTALFVGWAIATAIGLVPFLNVVWWMLGGVFGLGTTLVASWRARSVHGELVPGGRPGRHRAPRRPVEAPPPPVVAVAVGEEATSEERPADMPLAED